jgi:glycosyltransferase involved in cell wall biosynthesis
MPHRILVIITNPKQASYRLWIEPLRALLPEHGIELDVQVRPRGILARRALLKRAGEYHAVLLFRKLLDPSDAKLLRKHARRIIYALDDALMYHAHEVSAFSQWRTSRRFEATAGIADTVVAGNEYLAHFFRDRGKPATILPAYVDPAHYFVKTHAQTDRPALVWIGSRSTLPYLVEAMPAIREAARQAPLKLITIADAQLPTEPAPHLTIEHVAWSAQTEAASLLRGDIGIAPTPDTRWTRGKCGFKIIQYMASGLPAIASPVGANSQIIVPEQSGFLPRTRAEWTGAIVELARDPQWRQRLGQAGRQRVESEYSLRRAVDVWAGLLSESCASGASPYDRL